MNSVTVRMMSEPASSVKHTAASADRDTDQEQAQLAEELRAEWEATI